jgi:hypothetical protein
MTDAQGGTDPEPGPGSVARAQALVACEEFVLAGGGVELTRHLLDDGEGKIDLGNSAWDV